MQNRGAVTLEGYASIVGRPDWTDADIYRTIVCNLPRWLHALGAREHSAVLKRAPGLTGTHWDALLAAVAEHVAHRHGHPSEPWMDEPERFLDTPWMPSTTLDYMRAEALAYAPAAFLRHGTPVHPTNLDPRGGDPVWNAPPGAEDGG